ncbi:MAG: metal-dependent hydrolase [Nanoarchaeota archaeon]
MSFAFGHLFGAWCAGKIYEYFSKNKISHHAWFFLLLGGILPDADFLIDWIFGTDLHRTFSHSILLMILVPLAVYVFYSFLKHPDKKPFALFLGLGISMHFFLDGFSGYGIPLLWPMTGYFSFFTGFTPAIPDGGLLQGDAGMLLYRIKLAVVDMAIGTAWIFYLWFRRRIQF